MPLQQTGWRIKQFISQRRNGSLDHSAHERNHYTTRIASATTSRRGSWLSQIQMEGSTPRSSCVSPTISTASKNHRQPHLPMTTAYSSATSLCSCDFLLNAHPTASPLSGLHLAESTPEILYLPQSQLATGDAKTWRLIFSEKVSRTPCSRSSIFDQESEKGEATFDLLEALSIDMEKFSADTNQLILEMGEVSQSVGGVAASITWTLDANQGYHTPGTTISRSISTPTINKEPLYRRKANKRREQEAQGEQARANAGQRWNLADVTTNLIYLLRGKLLRTEADEMLTPARIQQLKNDIIIEINSKISSDNLHTVETDIRTPIEHFHLDSLSTCIDASIEVTNLSLPSPVLPPPSVPKKSERRMKCMPAEISIPGTRMVFEDVSFPPPPRNGRIKVHRGAPPLQTILEISPPIFAPYLTHNIKLIGVETSPWLLPRHTLLYSTAFTLTSPLFRHGPIQIEKTAVLPGEEATADEEALDWSAFQMAISGTMDEYCDTSERAGWDVEEAELNDTTEWFESFGWDGPGDLIREGPGNMRTRLYMQEQERIWVRGIRGDLIGGHLEESQAQVSRIPEIYHRTVPWTLCPRPIKESKCT